MLQNSSQMILYVTSHILQSNLVSIVYGKRIQPKVIPQFCSKRYCNLSNNEYNPKFNNNMAWEYSMLRVKNGFK